MFSFHLQSKDEYGYIEDSDFCPICTETLKDETKSLSICCNNNHVLHERCLEKLSDNGYKNCPECRALLIKKNL